MYLRARWVFSITRPPIEDGCVLIEGDRITFVGAASDLSRTPDLDLGDSTLLPGLINAHCHLEHSGRIAPPPPLTLRGGVFTEWVRGMNRVGAQFIAPRRACDRLIQTGTTTIADHCNPETPSLETPFRRIIFWEVLGAAKERAEASLHQAIERVKNEGGFVTPHSFYAVHKSVLEEILSHNSPQPPLTLRGGEEAPPLKVRGGWEGLWSIHLLESSDEDECLRHGTGPLADYVKERGGSISSSTNLLQYVPNGALIIHGNYLNSREIGALRDLNASVIHCPGSHRFFGHRRFPLEELKRAGVRIALGTDSLASNDDLSMLREMRLLRESSPDLDEAEILRMATIEGARALGMEKEIGSIEVGKKADLIAVKGNLFEAEEVCFSMIGGKIISPPSLPLP